MSTRFPWLTKMHEQELTKARKILVDLLDPTLHGIQSNSQEQYEINMLVGGIERLLGY